MSSPTTPPSAEPRLPGTEPLQTLRGDDLLAPLLERLSAGPDGERLEACEAAIGYLGQRLWADGLQPQLLPAYQALHRQREALLASGGKGPRHSFIVVIPVADRPRQLHACLDSLFELCRRFGYGGHDGNHFTRVEALVADDSGEAQSIHANREICADFTRRGLRTEHFDQQRQQTELQRLSATQRRQLARIIGEHPPDAFFHKGASIMRNITYLRLRRLCAERQRPILYFIDSDQTFRIKARGHGANSHYALNHLHHLDRLFSRGDTMVLTGKVVGAPPVSPAVMAGNFLDDAALFLDEIAHCDPRAACTFHTDTAGADDAAYHDMADLFGFRQASAPFRYQCDLRERHDHRRCLERFAARLNSFFDGAHPTRTSYYHPDPGSVDGPGVQAARTVYTGNYALKPEALRFFIPFAPLGLRMAGPVLGRLIRAGIGERFASANLPLLHQRTVEETGESEFRPGIHRRARRVDLSGEFERQFFGDVMLFTIERLTALGYPDRQPEEAQIQACLEQTERELRERYRDKQGQIAARLQGLRTRLQDTGAWWNGEAEPTGTRRAFQRFLDNIDHNFGPSAAGYRLIGDPDHRGRRLAQIRHAITGYPGDCATWELQLQQ
ncbi:MAG: hypothetical protein C3L25_02895 [Candidatus Sedimenticola endophacoides]|nr:MAG: hypothetical protein C3L26_02905 [Candidatus Sedimenticola endophacoides]PUE04853.1 MAG: hypothetical protein C3L25_02895 [Candidatus Sedimenticola endophacoides]